MDELNPFEDIAPYNDEEAAAALSKLAEHPNVPWISKYIFSNQPETYLRDILRSISTVDDFQKLVMSKATEWVIEKSVRTFSYDGLNKLQAIGGKYLAMSNHRDIILDPAFTQLILFRNQLPLTEICVGDNLLKSKTIERLIRSNRMIKVIRGISARELYLSSKVLSEYIRSTVTSGKNSVWIAQKQGRTKDGIDVTEQGLLKMVQMSGKGDFVSDMNELKIIPVAISYEFEPCDALKAREVYISRRRPYVKKEGEDLNSILTGMRCWKGRIKVCFTAPLLSSEIEHCALLEKNERFVELGKVVDSRIHSSYYLWPNNYIAEDILREREGEKPGFVRKYSRAAKETFLIHMEEQVSSVISDILEDETLGGADKENVQKELEDIFLHIYANPVRYR